MEEVALAICDNEEVILVNLDTEEEGGDWVADKVETISDPETEDMASIICELLVVASFSISIFIIISLLVMQSRPSGGRSTKCVGWSCHIG